jgi:hypothetical protein
MRDSLSARGRARESAADLAPESEPVLKDFNLGFDGVVFMLKCSRNPPCSTLRTSHSEFNSATNKFFLLRTTSFDRKRVRAKIAGLRSSHVSAPMQPGPDFGSKRNQPQAILEFERHLRGLMSENIHSEDTAGPSAECAKPDQRGFGQPPP